MDYKICDSKRCTSCAKYRDINYSNSEVPAMKRLEKIVASYAGVTPTLRKTNEATLDSEYQESVDNELSGGLV